jgi:5S rRNA maturation endonuclease (ribonuclease M5)
METPLDAARRLTAGIGKLESVYKYLDVEGKIIFCNLRIVQRNGEKTFRMMSSIGNGFELRRLESLKPLVGWPLYGLSTLDRPGAVWVVEGEKDADNLAALGFPCVTSGSTSTDGAADWSPLAGRDVILWPDNDDAGKSYMERIAKVLRSLEADISTVDIDGLELAPKEDCSDWLARHPSAEADEILALPTKDPQTCREQSKKSDTWREPESPVWPVLSEDALYGLAGDVVRTIEPHTEADPVAILLQFLAAAGNLLGRGLYAIADAARHGLVLFVVLVGETSKGRKGTSWAHTRNLIHRVDERWGRLQIVSGLSTGEGLIERFEYVDEDDGEKDKRLLVVQTEFAGALKAMERPGNTLSPAIRDFYDCLKVVQTLTRKKNKLYTTDARLSIIAHTTLDEPLKQLTETETMNGFANRFSFALVKRNHILPEGGNVPEEQIEALAQRLSNVVAAWKGKEQCFHRDQEAKKLWEERYEKLSEGKPGLYGAATSRAEAQVLRFSCSYAALDSSAVVRGEHLKAAFALQDYCNQSARFIFGDATGDSVADKILSALALGELARMRFARTCSSGTLPPRGLISHCGGS